MTNDMRQPKHGRKLFLVLALALNGCRSSNPPPIEVCILDGFGGGDCSEVDGTRKYRAPSEMKNYWSTNEDDIAKLTSWCYGSDSQAAKAQVEQFKEELKDEN